MTDGPPTVGVVGGGQLARMLAEAATPLGVHVRVLAADQDEGAAEVVPDLVRGSPDDPAALKALAESVDVVTIDHENVDHARWPTWRTPAVACVRGSAPSPSPTRPINDAGSLRRACRCRPSR